MQAFGKKLEDSTLNKALKQKDARERIMSINEAKEEMLLDIPRKCALSQITTVKSRVHNYYNFAERLRRIMEMEPGIKNMTLNEYLEYEAEKERQLWDNVEDGDDGDTYDIWDITVEDVERIKQFLKPNVLDEMDEVIQPLIPQPIHTIPPNDDYVAPATKLILDELLKEFRDEILNVTMVDEEANFNPTRDIEELERLLAKDPQSHFTKIQVYSVITKPEPFIHTQSLSPLYGIFESFKSSTKPYKIDKEM
ncbi:hypothetical protein Tco_1493425 [Tanacetum coccineum]